MTRDEKKKAAVEDYKNGRPCKSIAQEYGRSEATISSWARQDGCPKRPRGSRSPATPSDRDQRILRRRREGIRVKQVAKEFSLSVATIFSVSKKWAAWVEPPPPPVNGENAGLMPVNVGRKVRRGHGCDRAVQKCGIFINNEACIALWKTGPTYENGLVVTSGLGAGKRPPRFGGRASRKRRAPCGRNTRG